MWMNLNGQKVGIRWCMSVEIGDILFFNYHVTWGLQLHSTCTPPEREKLDLWPPLPIVILYSMQLTSSFFLLKKFLIRGYFSPEAMDISLSSLISLERLPLDFQLFRSLPNQERQRPPPSTRPQLPILTLYVHEEISRGYRGPDRYPST
jgi:hypothetical protein